MYGRLAIAVVAVCTLTAVSSPAPARAADAIVAHDTLVQNVWPLGGDLVYRRLEHGKPIPKREWMARFRGHLRPARGIPSGAGSGDIGRDAKGRKVFTFALGGANGASPKWFVYSLASNRSRPLHGLPTNCPVAWVAVWRTDMAYTAQCKGDSHPALFLRHGKRTRLVQSDPGGSPLRFRGGALAVIFDDGLDDFYVQQWMANGRSCSRRIDASWGDATDDAGWFPTDLRITNGYVTWIMGDWALRPDFAILAAKLPSGCAAPGPVGLFPFRPETTTLRALAVDERRVFYADDKTLRSHPLAATPSYDPPSNDNFENAQQLSGDAPLSATGRVAYATVQHGEPLAKTKHTVWFSYRPAKSGTVYVTVNPSCNQVPDNCGGLPRFGAYTGTSADALTEIPQSGGPYTQRYTRIDAVAGRTYRIAVGSPLPEPRHEPFTLHVDAAPPG
jgi:hypothetical protein